MAAEDRSTAVSEDVARYVARLLELLGDRDPLAVQRELVPRLGMILDDMAPDLLVRPEGPGKWSVGGVVRHLAHTEIVYAYRYRVVFAEDDPVLPGFDQDRWAARLADDPVNVRTAFTQLSHLREWNLTLLDSCSPADLRRDGRHSERGVEGLDQLIRLGAAHDLAHRRQIDRIRRALSG